MDGSIVQNRISCLIILGVLFLTPVVFSKSSQTYFKFQIKPGDNIDKLTQLISIDNVKDDTVYAYATETQFSNFKSLGYDYTILPNPGTLYEPLDFDKGDILLDWNTYPSYEAYVDSMYDFQADYPNLCRIYSIGNSVERREILFVKISANVDIEEDEPEIMYSSTMHGDETTGFILMLKLIKHLLTLYDHDPQVANILDNTEVWINPLANPDGTYHGGNHSVFGAIRYNANDVDLNRNFPDPEEGDHPDGNDWQPETMAMMNFFDRHSFVISANSALGSGTPSQMSPTPCGTSGPAVRRTGQSMPGTFGSRPTGCDVEGPLRSPTGCRGSDRTAAGTLASPICSAVWLPQGSLPWSCGDRTSTVCASFQSRCPCGPTGAQPHQAPSVSVR